MRADGPIDLGGGRTGHDQTLVPYEYNIAKAKELLTMAGYKGISDPKVHSISWSPLIPTEQGETTIIAHISSLNPLISISSVMLSVNNNTNITMIDQGGDKWNGTIPKGGIGENIKFKLYQLILISN